MVSACLRDVPPAVSDSVYESGLPNCRKCGVAIPKPCSIWPAKRPRQQNDSLFRRESGESLLTYGVNDGITTVRTRKRTETGDIRGRKAASWVRAGKLPGRLARKIGIVRWTARSAHKKSEMKKPDTDGKVNPPLTGNRLLAESTDGLRPRKTVRELYLS